MKLFALAVLFFISTGLSPTAVHAQLSGLFGGGGRVETIETEDLNRKLREHRESVQEATQDGRPVPDADFVVVDVRTDKETGVSVIPGAITSAMFEKDKNSYKDKLIIPYCTVGGRSGKYAKTLIAEGLQVKNYEGSILKWIDAGLPLVRLDGTPTNRVHTYSDRYRIPKKYEQVVD